MPAAEINPDYQTPFRLPQSVLGYLGRAYYETGRDVKAKTVLELALNKNNNDHPARLYLGLIRLRNGDAAIGRREVEASLRGIEEARQAHEGYPSVRSRTIRPHVTAGSRS